jgi:hypothetical protein
MKNLLKYFFRDTCSLFAVSFKCHPDVRKIA